MRKVFAAIAFTISAVFGLWFVLGLADSILRDGLELTVYSVTHMPAVLLTVGLPALSIGFYCVGASLLQRP